MLALESGWNGIVRPDNTVLYSLLSVAMGFAMTYWCVIDSQIRGYPILYSFYWIIFFLWPVAVPAYLIWSRKFWGLILVIINAIGLYSTILITYHLTGYLFYGDAWLEVFKK